MEIAAFYGRVARVIVFIHFLWTILLFGGGIAVLFYHAYAPYQVGIMTFTILMWLPFRGNCSLTLWEHYFREKSGRTYNAADDKPFMAKYLSKIFRRDFRPRSVSIFIASFYILSYAVSIWAWVRG